MYFNKLGSSVKACGNIKYSCLNSGVVLVFEELIKTVGCAVIIREGLSVIKVKTAAVSQGLLH